MTSPEAQPLWKTVVGDPEPWRRGRVFLIAVGCLSLVGQGLVVANAIISGFIEFAIFQAGIAVIYWLQFYFIWIGVHWVRWFNGGLNALYGFALLIWGFIYSNPITIIVGLYAFGVGCYMAFAPAVYFFAKRQKETVRRSESIAIGVGFLVLLGTLAAGFLALLGYRASVERDARQFADHAFRRIFSDHDTEFLVEHASPQLLQTGGDRAGLSRFIQDTTMRAGDVHDIAQSAGSLRFWYSFPLRLSAEGQVTTNGYGDKSRIQMLLIVSDAAGEWQIHAIRWQPDYSILPPKR